MYLKLYFKEFKTYRSTVMYLSIHNNDDEDYIYNNNNYNNKNNNNTYYVDGIFGTA